MLNSYDLKYDYDGDSYSIRPPDTRFGLYDKAHSQLARWLAENEEREQIEYMAKVNIDILMRLRNVIDKAIEKEIGDEEC